MALQLRWPMLWVHTLAFLSPRAIWPLWLPIYSKSTAANLNRSTRRPFVNLTAPTNGAIFAPGTAINLAAAATDNSGTVTKVEFYAGATLLYSAIASPFTFLWNNTSEGNYTLTTKAYDNLGASNTSAIVNITVNAPADQAPGVNMTAPAANATFAAPATINLAATASDSDGTISKVEFFNGATWLGEDASAPYTFSWSNVAAGGYALTAKATDNLGASSTSAVINVTVNPPADQAPGVNMTAPAANATFAAPATINLAATASDSDGTIRKVEFFNGAAWLGEDTSEPFAFSWSNVAAGNYALSAKATDNSGASSTSTPVNVTVAVATGCTLPSGWSTLDIGSPGQVGSGCESAALGR